VIFDEPTRGIDVGAKHEIYELMCELADQGIGIIMISSDMEELLGMSQRILVMADGKITGELTKEEFSQEKVLTYASNF
jgi:ribose transport system ATP-binding protein